MTAPLSDILVAVGRSDRDAFATLYDEFAPRMLGLVVNVLGSRHDAEDVLQDVFREVWRHTGKFDPDRGSAESWLFRLARSRTIDQLRRRSRQPATSHLSSSDSSPGSGGDSTGTAAGVTTDAIATSDASHRELAEHARAGVDELPDGQRDAVILAFFRGLTARQIADLRNLPHGTIKTRIRSGMTRLREHVRRQAEGVPS